MQRKPIRLEWLVRQRHCVVIIDKVVEYSNQMLIVLNYLRPFRRGRGMMTFMSTLSLRSLTSQSIGQRMLSLFKSGTATATINNE